MSVCVCLCVCVCVCVRVAPERARPEHRRLAAAEARAAHVREETWLAWLGCCYKASLTTFVYV